MEMGDETFELLGEQLDGPERGGFVLQMGGTCVSDLVVEDDRSGVGQVAEDLQVIVGQSWTAVQGDKGRFRAATKAKSFIVGLEGLVSVEEGNKSGVERSCLREADQCGCDERERPTESGNHDERAK